MDINWFKTRWSNQFSKKWFMNDLIMDFPTESCVSEEVQISFSDHQA